MSKIIKLAGQVSYEYPIVSVTFDVLISGRRWDVTGDYNLKTQAFAPLRVGVFGIEQAARDIADMETEVFTARLRQLFRKSRSLTSVLW